ncbi:MAG: hypothetical protein COW18_08385 [Zetaproteobacteria bacterium CG12_big_fil_rev_8_21_14_0_65_54_13]|nr:MAG: hypothetical protein COX55_01025 [Zetaproteobacteria bacterium CG23_combo_of_CG06-09_8_20_14_all_54_7]PIW47965.1 MAG: hypothetical protein COW18_08385 [Zetaproteobacteria bacterium CG12_big_fil_rev_8_21_14_0_65_54_13]PIX54699.1 MAG: hypothetical protein COZ50_06655 [Zetaproteobacteria bacterium CG_4_10_14_3_um_filter_54_28]PJA30958.1 MAG: hypothetical protein CO188_01155 [Zetaproteobacteria bacterium CG_4_9_14_3_um_filter_54_145]
MKYLFALTLLFVTTAATASEAVVQERLDQYRSQGAGDFDAARGESMWKQEHMQEKLGKSVNCASCHSLNLQSAGSHMRTGKRIEPMAPSVNPDRLGDTAKIEKWFMRNCKWTWGRECTAQEKGDLLTYIQSR